MRSDRIRPFFRPETGVFLIVWTFLMVVGRSKFLKDPGTFWHTVVGERMLRSGELITTDPFTFTWHGEHWVAHQWLGECVMALVHRLDGLDSLLLFSATLLATLYAWVAHRFIRAGLHWAVTCLVVMLIIATSSGHFHVRPHLGTIVFMGVTMGYLVDFEAGRIGWKRLWPLVPIFIVWTSIHGGTLGGLATLALAFGGWTVWKLMRRNSPIESGKQWLICAALFAACAATVVVNPYGIQLPRAWLAIMESPTLTRIIMEHRPLSLAKPDGWLAVGVAGVYVAALLSTWPRWPRVTWLLPLAWLVLMFTRVRHAPLFAVTAGVALADMLPFTRFARWSAGRGSALFRLQPEEERRPRSWKPALLPVLVVATSVVLQLARVPVPLIGHGWARLDPEHWPVELLPELREHEHDQPGGTRIFNDYLYGGFLIYHTPGYRVFVDDRCELFRDETESYPDQWLDEFVRAGATGGEAQVQAIQRWEERYGRFDLALVKTRSEGTTAGFDHYFRHSPQWVVVRRTPTATLYTRHP